MKNSDDSSRIACPGNDELVFSSNRRSGLNVWRKPIRDGVAVQLTTGRNQRPTDWSADGNDILFQTTGQGPGDNSDIWLLTLDE